MEIVKIAILKIALVIAVCVSGAFSGELPKLLVFAPEGAQFSQAISGITNELDSSFSITIEKISSETKLDTFEAKIREIAPNAITLMDNSAIRLYKEYEKAVSDKSTLAPVVALMAIDVERAIAGLSNIQGISYETPMVTALVNLRNVLKIPIEKVGVIYREKFDAFITKHAEFCKRDKIDIVKVMLDDKRETYPNKIKDALDRLIKKDKVNALWIPNDNVILKVDLLTRVWIPIVSKLSVPLVVGVETLVKPEFNFGTYAVIPDSKAAGEQAANLLSNLAENGWKFATSKVYPAIAVYSVLNIEKAKQFVDIKKIDLEDVNKVLMAK